MTTGTDPTFAPTVETPVRLVFEEPHTLGTMLLSMPRNGSAADAFAALLVDLAHAERAEADGADIEARFTGGHRAQMHVLEVTTATAAHGRHPTGGDPLLIVGDRIPAGVRAALSDAGVNWWDRRGHLRVQSGPVLIDIDVPAEPRVPVSSAVNPLGGVVVAGVSFTALKIHPQPLPGVRDLSRRIDASPGGVSLAVRRLTDAGLLTVDGVAAHPGLFWAVTDRWRPAWNTLHGIPAPVPGIVAVGSLAAAELGAPIAVADTGPVELLAADQAIYRTATRSATGPGTARIAIAPTPVACNAADTSERAAGHPCAHPVVVAALLGADPGRGAEIIQDWELPDRAW